MIDSAMYDWIASFQLKHFEINDVIPKNKLK